MPDILTKEQVEALKEKMRGDAHSDLVDDSDILSLLARLEAAERIMKDYVEHGVLQCGPCMKRIETWRKAAGKL